MFVVCKPIQFRKGGILLKAPPGYLRVLRAARNLLLVCTYACLGPFGCSNDKCSVCPEEESEQEYQFLYSYIDTGYWVHTISTKSGRSTDSIRYGEFPFWDVDFTSTGLTACYTSTESGSGAYHSTWLTDYVTGDTLANVVGIGGHAVTISSDDSFVMISLGNKLAILGMPNLTVLYEENSNFYFRGAIHPFGRIAYVPIDQVDSLKILHISADAVVDSMIPLRNEEGEPVYGRSAAMSADGSMLFMSVADFITGRRSLQVLSTSDFELIAHYSFPLPVAAVHPDGRRLFLVNGHIGDIEPPLEGAVYELDLSTLLIRKILDGAQFTVPGSVPFGLSVESMEITPDGRFGIFMSGYDSFAGGPLYKVDLSTYQIDAVFHQPKGVNRLIRMYPIERK